MHVLVESTIVCVQAMLFDWQPFGACHGRQHACAGTYTPMRTACPNQGYVMSPQSLADIATSIGNLDP